MTKYTPKTDIPTALQALLAGTSVVRVEGDPTGKVREKALEDAIAALQAGGGDLLTGYIGVKNYAGFGDQRSDHQTGMVPRHGTIVFRVELVSGIRSRGTLTAEETEQAVHLLLATRDYGGLDRGRETWNLWQALQAMREALTLLDAVGESLDAE